MSTAADMSASLLLTLRALLGQVAYGSTVDYRAAGTSEAYAGLQADLQALAGLDPLALTSNTERTAFWINLYNALMIDAVLRFRVRRRIGEVSRVFDRVGCVVGGLWFSANDIEHGVLRANRRHPLRLRRPFGVRDPRRGHALGTLDARIHFALNCAARSCPPIRYYAAENLDAQLTMSARACLGSGQVTADRSRMCVRLPRLLYFYAPDFGGGRFTQRGRRRLLDGVMGYLPDAELADWIAHNRARLTIDFDFYDWSLNSDDKNRDD